ncbi:unnamed protein product [Cuscuta campestris]|uniref:Protein kinase domain-containing protein n=1 Tax=Cuscuta campestris TaxID=132261 RepID=A0A484KQ33_9ASTE|nr:unnamed protein product [Cuscuta campestris]
MEEAWISTSDLGAMANNSFRCGKGVEYLHCLAQQGLIHQDLKPSDILLDDNMRAKVADFGLVKRVPDKKSSLLTVLS